MPRIPPLWGTLKGPVHQTHCNVSSITRLQSMRVPTPSQHNIQRMDLVSGRPAKFLIRLRLVIQSSSSLRVRSADGTPPPRSSTTRIPGAAT